MRNRTSKVLKIFAVALFVLATVLILVGYAGVFYFQGFREFLWLLNPFNWKNVLMVILAWGPALFLFWLSKKLSNEK